MRNLILIFLIILFSVSFVYADTENRIKKPPLCPSDIDVIKHMKKHNPDKRFFRHAPAATVRLPRQCASTADKHGERVLSQQVHYKRKPIILDRQQDAANIYFIPGSIAFAAIAYLISEKIWQYFFIEIRIGTANNYRAGIRIHF